MRAVFLDRDDTLMEANSLPAPPPPAAPGDVCDPALVRLLPGALEACRLLREAGYLLVVVSNQGVVARGGASEDRVRAVNARLASLLKSAHGEPLIGGFYYCPFHPRGNVPQYTREHPWRKPAPGMILAAAEDLELDLRECWLVGDAARDVEAGLAAGIPARQCLRIGPEQPLPSVLGAARVIAGAPG
jgi:histidinol-phosphate phosphatase family protein